MENDSVSAAVGLARGLRWLDAFWPVRPAAEPLLPRPSRTALFRLLLQRAIGRIFLLPFAGFLVFLMHYVCKYKIDDRDTLRRKFREIVKGEGPLLICANHLTFIDSALMIWAFAPNLWYVRNFRYFSWNLPAGDFFKKKLVFRLVAYLSKCIFIHRDGTKDHKNSILGTCHYLLERGEIVSVFPEGRRSRSGRFDPEHITYGVGKVLAATPGCRVLCVYLRGDKQATYSNYPAKGSRFRFSLETLVPETRKAGKDAYFELTSQVALTLKRMEQEHFASLAGTASLPQKPVALVTGATAGIGRALTQRLAESGYDLALVARDGERLREVARECEARFGTRVLSLVADLSRPDSAGEIAKSLAVKNISPDLLINNAGFGVHGEFMATDLDTEEKLISIQITSLIQLTKRLLPAMAEKKCGRILNVSSVYAYSPVPLQSVYAACKAFMLSFSQSLADEVEPLGIGVTVLLPGTTQTEFRKRAGIHQSNPEAGMTAEAVARFALKAVERGDRIAIPGRVNRLFVKAARHLPPSALPALMRTINHRRGVNR